mmetsp:Transcript_37248/g.92708  ORF Transcript_37248/g.92708 Transcript_37248/m.92708 type:complete len:370 (+) Transcript_37248:240-1349(+)
MEDNLDIDWDSEFTKVLNVGSTIKLICLSFELFVGQTASSAARAVLRELLRRGWVGVIVVDEADVVAIDGCEPGASYPRKPFRKVLSDLGPALVEMCRSLRVLRPPLAAITASLAPAHHSLLASALWLGAHGKERETVAVMCPLHQINLRLDVQTPDASHARAEQLASCVSDMVGKCLSGELGRAEGKVVLYFNTIAALKSSIAKIERAIRRDHGNVQGEGGGAARVRVFVCHAGPDEAVRTERERLFREDAPADVFFIYLATDVIGRGLNASDVLFVVHDGMPVHLSQYVQRNGRARRRRPDGRGCCIMFLHFKSRRVPVGERTLVECGRARGCTRVRVRPSHMPACAAPAARGRRAPAAPQRGRGLL